MSKEPSPNTRRSQWEVFDRCLTLLQRLMRGVASGNELWQIVRDKAVEDGDSDILASAVDKRFEEDRARLRNWFECEIDYDRTENQYTLLGMDRALIDLNDDALRGLAFLHATFRTDGVPMSKEVQALLNQLLMAMPKTRWQELERERGLLELDLAARDQDSIEPIVWQKVQEAVSQRQQLEFEHKSPSQPIDQSSVLHIVEPVRYFFDPFWGHYYLEACHVETYGPAGRKIWTTAILERFRMGRIQNPRVLPTRFVANGRRYKKWELVYELSPLVTRGGITLHFPNSTVVERKDGAVEVRTESTNLFFDVRRLLHYGENCRIIGGEEALMEIGKLVQGIAEQYPT